MRFNTTIVLVTAIMTLSGCLHTQWPYKPYKDDMSHHQVSESVLMLADNQLTEERNAPIIEQSSIILRNTVPGRSVYRAGVLNALSLEIVRYILENNTNSKLVIHVGDALNNSCISEYNLFVKAMNNKIWFIAPGNHDGYYLGITMPIEEKECSIFGLLNQRVGWCQACKPYYQDRNIPCQQILNNKNSMEYRLDKRGFTKRYLDTLGVNISQCRENEVCYPGINSVKYDRKNYLDEMAVYLSGESTPWKSFVVQKLHVHRYDNPNTKAFAIIILDTAAYTKKPRFLYHNVLNQGAAGTAEIVEDQKKVVVRWLKKLHQDKTPVILIGHHPIKDFNKASKQYFQNWYQKEWFEMYFSGDVHDGYYVKHRDIKRITGENKEFLKEANLGSTLDAPIEYMRLTSFSDNENSKKQRFFTERFFMTPYKDKTHKTFIDKNGNALKKLDMGEWDKQIRKSCPGLDPFDKKKAQELYCASSDVKNLRYTHRMSLSRKAKMYYLKMLRYRNMFHIYKEVFDKVTYLEQYNSIKEAEKIIKKQINDNMDMFKILKRDYDNDLCKLSGLLDGISCKIVNGKCQCDNKEPESLQELALGLDKNSDKAWSKDIEQIKLCAALYAAELDYKYNESMCDTIQ